LDTPSYFVGRPVNISDFVVFNWNESWCFMWTSDVWNFPALQLLVYGGDV